MLTVNFNKEVLVGEDRVQHIPVLDTSCTIQQLILRLEQLERAYPVEVVQVVGPEVVGSINHPGDYYVLALKLRGKGIPTIDRLVQKKWDNGNVISDNDFQECLEALRDS